MYTLLMTLTEISRKTIYSAQTLDQAAVMLDRRKADTNPEYIYKLCAIASSANVSLFEVISLTHPYPLVKAAMYQMAWQITD